MSIDYKREDYLKAYDVWQKIEHVIKQEELKQYLLTLNAFDTSDQNKCLNENYKKRAVFYPLTAFTVEGMVGSVFRKTPTLNVPPSMEYVTNNVDGAGNSIYQQSQAVFAEVIAKGRAGLVVSYPPVEGEQSQADIVAGRNVPTISYVDPEQVINWRTETIGSKTFLSLVVIAEDREQVAEDGYTVECISVRRELLLDNGVYVERIWYPTDEKDEWVIEDEFIPRKANGSTWSSIPFTFVGSENNDWFIDNPPMKAMANLNIAHYRNSADYEESVFLCGQAQAYIDSQEISQDMIDNLEKNNFYIGSRALAPFKLGFAQADPNPLVRQAMVDKVEQMASIGARMVQPGSASKTATQSRGEQEVQHSTISLVAANVSEAYTMCLQWMGEYANVTHDFEYSLNVDLLTDNVDANKLKVMGEFTRLGLLPKADWIRYMKKEGLFEEDKTVEDYLDELDVTETV
tara:strand:+ start:1639 stop:3018 length:1380 start_codon:yes stop_codon:yes gene_type:complete